MKIINSYFNINYHIYSNIVINFDNIYGFMEKLYIE